MEILYSNSGSDEEQSLPVLSAEEVLIELEVSIVDEENEAIDANDNNDADNDWVDDVEADDDVQISYNDVANQSATTNQQSAPELLRLYEELKAQRMADRMEIKRLKRRLIYKNEKIKTMQLMLNKQQLQQIVISADARQSIEVGIHQNLHEAVPDIYSFLLSFSVFLRVVAFVVLR